MIDPAYKYGLVAIPGVLNEITFEPGELDGGLYVLHELPIEIDEHWIKWVGTLQIDALHEANLCLLAVRPTETPEALDADNQICKRRAEAFYHGILFSDFLETHGRKPVRLTGANRDGDIDVRQYTPLSRPIYTTGSPFPPIDEERIHRAAELGKRWLDLQNLESHRRVKTAIRIFLRGVCETEAGERGHQFVRCIEGFVKPATGNTRSQLKSRTELFLGPSYHELMDDLFKIRSIVEHLNRREDAVEGPDLRSRLVMSTQRIYEAEAIARYCISRFLEYEVLWEHYENDSVIEGFWNLEEEESRDLWGEPLDVAEVSAAFEVKELTDERLGLS